jgi:hypothetical protein
MVRESLVDAIETLEEVGELPMSLIISRLGSWTRLVAT